MNNNNCKMGRLKAYWEIHEYKVLSGSGTHQEKPSEVVGFGQSLLNAIFYVAFHSTNSCEVAAWAGSQASWSLRCLDEWDTVMSPGLSVHFDPSTHSVLYHIRSKANDFCYIVSCSFLTLLRCLMVRVSAFPRAKKSKCQPWMKKEMFCEVPTDGGGADPRLCWMQAPDGCQGIQQAVRVWKAVFKCLLVNEEMPVSSSFHF